MPGIEAITSGDVRAAARLMRLLDDQEPAAFALLAKLHPLTGRARVVGITGSPGVGKSTLTDALVAELRKRGQTVGVVAVDPTSPFSGGAILGDRVRMQRHATDEGVFIRSMATRGHFGGLTPSTQAVVKVMDAMGKDVILVETVGVGQDEVDVVRLADTTVVVTVPGLGDDIQAIKAGILEVADLFVVNKADREGMSRTVAELQAMIAMDSGQERRGGWRPPVVTTVANAGQGLPELVETLDAHWSHQCANGGCLLADRRTERARMELLGLLQQGAMQRLMAAIEGETSLDQLVRDIADGKTDPYSESLRLVGEAFNV